MELIREMLFHGLSCLTALRILHIMAAAGYRGWAVVSTIAAYVVSYVLIELVYEGYQIHVKGRK